MLYGGAFREAPGDHRKSRALCSCRVVRIIQDRKGHDESLEGELVSNGADNQRPWDLTINAKDLRDVALATTTTYTVLGDLERGLLVQPEGSEDECKTILLGRERQ